MTDRTSYARSVAALREECQRLEARLAASKRYRGRAQDARDLAATQQTLAEAEAEQAEYDAWEREEVEARQQASDAHQAFRSRVATRAYYMALNGEGTSDDERWLWAEGFERGADIQAARDALPEHHFGEWLSPSERRRRDRAVGLH